MVTPQPVTTTKRRPLGSRVAAVDAVKVTRVAAAAAKGDKAAKKASADNKAKLKAAEKAANDAAKKAAKDLKVAQEAQAKQAKIDAVTGKLTPIANEVNVRIGKAEKMEHDADDHRLAAILKLEEARKVIEADGKLAGLKFKDWCEKNVKWSPESIRKMLPVAQAKDPVKALADLRSGNAARNKKSRDKKKKVATSASPAAQLDMTKPKTLVDLSQKAKPEVQLAAMTKVAKDLGMRVVSETDAKKLDSAADAPAFATVDDFKKAFANMKGVDQMKIATFCAATVGATLAMPEPGKVTSGALGDPGEIPANLKK